MISVCLPACLSSSCFFPFSPLSWAELRLRFLSTSTIFVRDQKLIIIWLVCLLLLPFFFELLQQRNNHFSACLPYPVGQSLAIQKNISKNVLASRSARQTTLKYRVAWDLQLRKRTRRIRVAILWCGVVVVIKEAKFESEAAAVTHSKSLSWPAVV